MCQVTGSRSDVKDAGAGMEKWKKVFASVAMHMWCRNGCGVANTLRRVCIWIGGGIIGAVDLPLDLIISFFTCISYLFFRRGRVEFGSFREEAEYVNGIDA